MVVLDQSDGVGDQSFSNGNKHSASATTATEIKVPFVASVQISVSDVIGWVERPHVGHHQHGDERADGTYRAGKALRTVTGRPRSGVPNPPLPR